MVRDTILGISLLATSFLAKESSILRSSLFLLGSSTCAAPAHRQTRESAGGCGCSYLRVRDLDEDGRRELRRDGDAEHAVGLGDDLLVANARHHALAGGLGGHGAALRQA
jgi:hypothetical protein